MYNVFYKTRTGTMVLPCRSLAEGKTIANNLFKKGHIGIKLCKIEETVLYVPSVDQ